MILVRIKYGSPSQLIHNRLEPLRSKRIFKELSILKVAFFVLISLFHLI